MSSTALSVFYRSQMGRGARIKCIKCPLLSFMNGLKDLQSSVIRTSIIVTPGWNLQRWPQEKNPQGIRSITSSVKSVPSTSTPWELKKKERWGTKLPQHLNTWSLPLGMLLQLNTPFIIRFSTSPLSSVALAFQPVMQSLKKLQSPVCLF